MAGAKLNTFLLNTTRLNNGTAIPVSFNTEANRLQDSKPITKVEFIGVDASVTDISAYYREGAQFDQQKDRAAGEIQAGDFDIIFDNCTNYFSEFVPGSLLYGKQYHMAQIRVSLGFILPDGTTSYLVQTVAFIDELLMSDNPSYVTFRCRDLIGALLDTQINLTPTTEIPTPNGGNVGNGTCSAVAVKPLKTKNENWTLTCTTPGGDGTAIFSVVGSVSGTLSTATSGTEYETGTGAGGIKFTISAGSTPWSAGDKFTFSTKQHPEWSATNAGKIIWGILTGYNWDSNTAESWAAQAMGFDHTQSSANPDLNYDSFVATIATLTSAATMNLTGYIQRDQSAAEAITSLVVLFLGSIYTNKDGKISIQANTTSYGSAISPIFEDNKKIRSLIYNRNIDEVINYVVVNYKKLAVFEFSDETIVYQGCYAKLDTTSIGKYGELTYGLGVPWFATNGVHVQDMADKIVARYSEPPLNIDLETGADALNTVIGDIVGVTDVKFGFNKLPGEVIRITKNLDARPLNIALRIRRDTAAAILYGYLGSSANEGDGLSPQNADYDSASANDKTFCYLGDASTPAPDYRMF
jgi:hypothetical protein